MDEEEHLIRSISTLVEAGEYLDELLGLPGVRLEGGGAFLTSSDGRARRLYQRGTPEHLAAKAAGLVERLPPLTRAAATAVSEAEHRLGRALPGLLRRLYTEVGNGGFGPGYGLMGVPGGHVDDGGDDILSLHARWPLARPEFVAICTWGCGIYSLVDVSTPEAWMWGFDPNPVPQDQLDQAFFPQAMTLAGWLRKWVDGRLYQPALVLDEVAGAWRAATDEEMRQFLSEE